MGCPKLSYYPTNFKVENYFKNCLTSSKSVLNTRSRYEISDHLGNVRAVVSDLKESTLNGTTGAPEDFEPVVATISNYYPFGMMQPGRNFGAEDSRYGFNGMEKDN